jgi:hypothetical protein
MNNFEYTAMCANVKSLTTLKAHGSLLRTLITTLQQKVWEDTATAEDVLSYANTLKVIELLLRKYSLSRLPQSFHSYKRVTGNALLNMVKAGRTLKEIQSITNRQSIRINLTCTSLPTMLKISPDVIPLLGVEVSTHSVLDALSRSLYLPRSLNESYLAKLLTCKWMLNEYPQAANLIAIPMAELLPLVPDSHLVQAQVALTKLTQILPIKDINE